MSKNIKDYLHLYLGCDCIVQRADKKRPPALDEISLGNLLDWASYNDMEVKPILRPLSDMTEDEKVELVETVTYSHIKFSSKESALECFDKENYSKNIKHMTFLADEVVWLLSKHFDLFGLSSR